VSVITYCHFLKCFISAVFSVFDYFDNPAVLVREIVPAGQFTKIRIDALSSVYGLKPKTMILTIVVVLPLCNIDILTNQNPVLPL
jgi:hypothetical protein